MRAFALAVCVLSLCAGSALAGDFPGPKVKDERPFNSPNVMTGGALSCPKMYDRSQFMTAKRTIVADVKMCVQSSFGIQKDIGLDFGSPRSPYEDCVVPSSYDARPPSNNPMWPVCCPVKLATGNYRMACRLFFTAAK